MTSSPRFRDLLKRSEHKWDERAPLGWVVGKLLAVPTMCLKRSRYEIRDRDKKNERGSKRPGCDREACKRRDFGEVRRVGHVAEQTAAGNAVDFVASLDLFHASEVSNDRVGMKVEDKRCVVEDDSQYEARVGEPIEREVRTEVADVGGVQVAVKRGHEPATQHDCDAERGRCALWTSNQIGEHETAVAVMNQPDKKEEERDAEQ